MRGTESKEKGDKGTGFYFAAVFLSLVFYVASTGPIIGLSIHGTNKYKDQRIENAAFALYKPLSFVMKPFGRQRWAEYWIQTRLGWTVPTKG